MLVRVLVLSVGVLFGVLLLLTVALAVVERDGLLVLDGDGEGIIVAFNTLSKNSLSLDSVAISIGLIISLTSSNVKNAILTNG